MKDIKINMIFDDLNHKDYKIHFARKASVEPLDEYMIDFENWKWWNKYSTKNDFNRQFIFSLICFYPERDTWLFGGIWEVISTDMSKIPHPYEIKLVEDYSQFIGRLKIYYPYNKRSTRVKLENHFDDMLVKEILVEPYSTIVFPGYKNVDISFITLENIMNKDTLSWKNALSIKGIYLITDISTGKRYVGKADGEKGIWQRWGDYIRDGHGGDVDLRKLVNAKGFDYIRKNYKFTILEVVTGWDEYNINDRESYWKRVLLSREEALGHNKN